MSPERALSVWQSIRTTFILFLIVVPLVIVTNGFGAEAVDGSQTDVILSAIGLLVLAAVIAEILRRTVNFYAGGPICQWRGKP